MPQLNMGTKTAFTEDTELPVEITSESDDSWEI